MRKLFSVLSFVLFYITFAYGQAAVDIPLTGSDGTATIPMAVGLDLTATNCIDPSLGEAELPPLPPPGIFDIRFDLGPYGCPALTVAKDYRPAAAFPFTGVIQHTMNVQRSSAGLPVEIAYQLPTGAVMTITDAINGLIYTSGPLTGTGAFTISGVGASLLNFWVSMNYTNVGPSGPTPIFAINPPSLDFGSVLVGGNASLPVTVSNPGDGDLIISNIVSSDPEFTFSPNTFPITIAAGGDQVFDVTFAPTSGGLHSANLSFSHNAAGSPTSYAVQGTGVATAPVFNIAPPSLNFGSVNLGSNLMMQATVTNTGNADLIISNITSSNPQFTFTPSAPITIGPGLNQVFDITFTPTAAGSQTGTIVFTHNAAGSPKSYSVQGIGVDPGPTFVINHTSLNFGTVNVGDSHNLTVLVTNSGAVNTLIISSAAIAEPEFIVNPTSANIPAGGNQLFTVTFTPPAAGPFSGTLVFTDNAPGSPQSVALSGTGYVPPAVYGLIFENEKDTLLEDAFYMETIQLKALTGYAKAVQFRLLVNRAPDDTPILTFQNIQKGTNVSDPTWILDYNVIRGPILPNGASCDTIMVLLYNIHEGEGWTLGPGDWNDLLHVNFKVANLPALQDLVKSSFLIKNAEASTYDGFSIDITPSRDQLAIYAKNRVQSIGDVNGDGCLDILDLIMVVDHIVGRDSLEGDFFTRADIAPWQPGAPEPNPDGFVNVQDLSLIQNIILSGFYPDGRPVGPCSYAMLGKLEGDAEAKVTFYINKEGISAYLESIYDIRGAQIEFSNMINNPENLQINTELGQGYYQKVNDMFRVVLYDRMGNKYIESGEHFMADMPFTISNPEDLNLETLILVTTDRQIVQKVQVEIIYGQTPALPLDYILYQNYPNPFNPATTVRFQVPQTSSVTVDIYNMLGQKVRTLFQSQVARGTYSVAWDGRSDAGVQMSSGTYIYRMTAGAFVQSKKMVLLK